MTIAWWSAGITSAVACKKALKKYKDVRIMYIETGSAHQDNKRFMTDCEAWYGQKIETVQNKKYDNHFDVIDQTKFINSAFGARCTLELKKNVRIKIERKLKPDNQIFGFEFSEREINRAIRFKETYPRTNPLFPLIEDELNKNECAGILAMANIKLPEMYKMGYSNNNCIGCVKGGKGYWNKIRIDFPHYFWTMAKLEREIGHSAIKGVYLDKLGASEGNKTKVVILDCGIFCAATNQDIIDKRVIKIIEGDLSICAI